MNVANEFFEAMWTLIKNKKQREEIAHAANKNHRHQPYCWRVALRQSPLPL